MGWALEDMREEFRELVGDSSIEDVVCDDKLNKAYLYKFPTLVRPPELQTWWEFETQEGVDTYTPSDGFSSIPAYPAYANGYALNVKQNPALFYDEWPQYHNYPSRRPYDGLLYGGSLILRPVPDDVYQIKIQAWLRPSELVSPLDTPIKEEWGEVICYIAAREHLRKSDDKERLATVQEGLENALSQARDRTYTQKSSQCIMAKF